MNLFDQIKSQLGDIAAMETAGAAGAQSPAHDPHAMLDSVMGLITEHGGVGGLVEKLKGSGLASAVASWVSTGENERVSGEQVESAVGSDTIGQIAAKLGVTNEHARSLLSQYLPAVIDHLTPNGKVEEGSLLEKGLGMLKAQFQAPATAES